MKAAEEYFHTERKKKNGRSIWCGRSSKSALSGAAASSDSRAPYVPVVVTSGRVVTAGQGPLAQAYLHRAHMHPQ